MRLDSEAGAYVDSSREHRMGACSGHNCLSADHLGNRYAIQMHSKTVVEPLSIHFEGMQPR